jgi:hypothetical protein
MKFSPQRTSILCFFTGKTNTKKNFTLILYFLREYTHRNKILQYSRIELLLGREKHLNKIRSPSSVPLCHIFVRIQQRVTITFQCEYVFVVNLITIRSKPKTLHQHSASHLYFAQPTVLDGSTGRLNNDPP